MHLRTRNGKGVEVKGKEEEEGEDEKRRKKVVGLTVAAKEISAVFHHIDTPPDVCASTVNIVQNHMEEIWSTNHHLHHHPWLWNKKACKTESNGERRKESTKAKPFLKTTTGTTV